MTSLDDLPIRDDLRGLTPYGAPQLDVPVRLNVNENAYRVPESVALDIVQEIARALPDANRYPDREFVALREEAEEIGFAGVMSGPLVRSSYHADRQAHAASVRTLEPHLE